MNKKRSYFWLYFFVLLLLIVSAGEVFFRKHNPDLDPLTGTGYSAAISQFSRLQAYVQKYGPPDCIFFGNSLVQVGVDPITFTKAFEAADGPTLNCYNFGVDASTMSSTMPMVKIVSRMYKPTYVFVGIQGYSFRLQTDSSHQAEDSFQNDSWVKFAMGKLDLRGWLIDRSALYNNLDRFAAFLFAQQSLTPAPEKATVHPELSRTIDERGYGPLQGYRDESPVFLASDAKPADLQFDLDPRDWLAFKDLVKFGQNSHLHLIFFETPISAPPDFFLEIDRQSEAYARENGIPYLSVKDMPPLPATAFSDRNHLQINGSRLFSEWLGGQMGKALANGGLYDVESSDWSPVFTDWPAPTYVATLGLTDQSYADYLLTLPKFNLIPEKLILFSPGERGYDPQILQSLIGFYIDSRPDLASKDRENYFRFITVLGKTQYLDDLKLSAEQEQALEVWGTTLDRAVMDDLGIRFILCWVDMADASHSNCPAGIIGNPDYLAFRDWNFRPLYEKFILYKMPKKK